ncbi:MAG TPA: xanthine dehydrogenase family protein subunit M [Atribacterota bacterium]|nr:xanthine dehydrogenase family protein subunit M [Atribacterota bacterium]
MIRLKRINEFEYFAPSTLAEAISLLAQYKEKARVFSGGTDLLVQMKQRKATPEYLIDLKNIAELKGITYSAAEGLKIGATVTHGVLATSPVIPEKYDMLKEASLAVGSVQTRNRGTIVGNIGTSSPSADTPPALLALDARLKLVSADGERVIPLTDFYAGPFKNVLEPTELITEIQIPDLPENSAGTYLWHSKITEEDETLVGVGVVLTINSREDKVCTRAGIGLCSVAPTPMRARKAEEFLKGKKINDNVIRQAAEIASQESLPRSRAEYRREMVKVNTRRALTKALKRIEE